MRDSNKGQYARKKQKGKEKDGGRRSFLKKGLMAASFTGCGFTSVAFQGTVLKEKTIRVEGVNDLDQALQICAEVYPKNRRKDILSSTNKTGYRMTVSPNGFPVAICMCPDLTFGMLGARFLENKTYLNTFRGHLDHLPRNMRRNGKFFLNEDMLSGADRVFTQVMYPIWIWELYLALGDIELLKFHQIPLLKCLGYIEGRTSPEGIVTQVDPDDWQYSEGADWVDWCPERMEGSTCVYHTWYVHALEYCVEIFRILEDVDSMKMVQKRRLRQYNVLNTYFWNGTAYWDNLNFQGEKVGRFWCDSQIWPIAFGYASEEQAAAIFERIDGSPNIFEGVPLRWCAPIAEGDEDPRYGPDGKYGDTRRPHLREFSWFGRLGSGDILARYHTGQKGHAMKLIMRFAELVTKLGTVTECLDMNGVPRRGTSGGGDYLEHAGGFIWCVGKGTFGIEDTKNGMLTWAPKIPQTIKSASVSYWHMGNCWEFGCDEKNYWIDPKDTKGVVEVYLDEKKELVTVDGKKWFFPRKA